MYEHVEDVECPDYYCFGGFHPVHIGDTLGARYRIVHKLGYGSFSTTWLARDNHLQEYVAVKVGTAKSDTKEIDVMAQLASKNETRALISPVLDRFHIQGPNGAHPCLITTPARCSLAAAKDSYGIFRPDVSRSLAAQLVMAVACMHDHGYVHGGKFLCCTIYALGG